MKDTTTAVVVAVIALGASLLSTVVSLYGQFHTAETQARREAETTLARYREPLLGAAFELQSRLFNILRQDFLQKYFVDGSDEQRQYATRHTLYLFGQYLAWTEILRRRIQSLSFGEVAETQEVSKLQEDIRHVMASDEEGPGRPFMLFRGEQRAIGELMTTSEDGELACLGFAAFNDVGSDVWKWFERLENDLAAVASTSSPRLQSLQHALVDLIELLDRDRRRFPQRLKRA